MQLSETNGLSSNRCTGSSGLSDGVKRAVASTWSASQNRKFIDQCCNVRKAESRSRAGLGVALL